MREQNPDRSHIRSDHGRRLATLLRSLAASIFHHSTSGLPNHQSSKAMPSDAVKTYTRHQVAALFVTQRHLQSG